MNTRDFEYKEKIISKIFAKNFWTDKEASISIQCFQKYIEKGGVCKGDYKNWINENTIETIKKYIDYYLTH
jgi:REP element-mobilizing transposase RayT